MNSGLDAVRSPLARAPIRITAPTPPMPTAITNQPSPAATHQLPPTSTATRHPQQSSGRPNPPPQSPVTATSDTGHRRRIMAETPLHAPTEAKRLRGEEDQQKDQEKPSPTRSPNQAGSAQGLGFAAPSRPAAKRSIPAPNILRKSTPNQQSKARDGSKGGWGWVPLGLQKVCPLCLEIPSSVGVHIQSSDCHFIKLNHVTKGNGLDYECRVPDCLKCFQPTKLLNNEKIAHDYHQNHTVTCALCHETVPMYDLGCHLIKKSYNFFVECDIFCKSCPSLHFDSPVDFFVHIQEIHRVSFPNLHHFVKYIPDSFTRDRKLLIFCMLHVKYSKFM